MAYQFVQAFNDYGPRRGPVRAFVTHMAEGGGTVGYLSRRNPNGVSVHYVIEYSGRIVQMLRESRASGSIRPSAIRQTDDEPFTSPDGATVTFGNTAVRRALGEWHRDPNSVVITLEFEGFAKDGPNAAQARSHAELIRDVRSRYPNCKLLAHRDFASYKGCPGRRILWASLGGHASHPFVPEPPEPEEEMPTQWLSIEAPPTRAKVDIPAGRKLLDFDGATVLRELPALTNVESPFAVTKTVPNGASQTLRAIYAQVGDARPRLGLALPSKVTDIVAGSPADCSDEVADAREKALDDAAAALAALR